MATDPNESAKYRKKKKSNTMLLRFMAVFLIVGGAVVIWLNADTIFEPLRGIASKIETTTSNEEGFPVQLPGSAGYSFSEFGGNFLLLTDTYLYTYYPTGRQIYALQHGYTNPVQEASDRRILLYDKNSYEFSLYNKTSKIYEKTLEDKIVYGALSGDMAAIVTTSARYSNVLYIYDGNGNWKYIKRFVDENVMQVAFTDGNNAVLVTTLGVSDGEIISTVYKFDITTDEAEIWSYKISGNTLTIGLEASSERVTVIGDNKIISLDEKTGELIGSYIFTNTPVCFAATDKYTAILLHEASTNRQTLVSLSADAEPLGSTEMPINTVQVAIDGEMVYTLGGSTLGAYSAALEKQSETELYEEYSSFVKIGGEAYLLGYDVVERVTIAQ